MNKGCPKCGRMIDSNAQTCPYCNYDFGQIDKFFQKQSDKKYLENEKYAGFTKRLVAGLFDQLIVSLLVAIIFIICYRDKITNINDISNLNISFIMLFGTYFVIYVLYNAICERTPMHGSLGKKILGLEVIDEFENPVTFDKALIRNIAKILNVVTMGIGFLLSAVPPKKQALNDRIANTYVINKLVMKNTTDTLNYANPIKRLFAYIIDIIVIYLLCKGIIYLADYIVKMDNVSTQTINMVNSAKGILCMVITFFYFPAGESRNGATFGKKMMSIRITEPDGLYPTFVKSFVRQFLVPLDTACLGFLLVLVTSRKQTINDLISNTVIIDK